MTLIDIYWLCVRLWNCKTTKKETPTVAHLENGTWCEICEMDINYLKFFSFFFKYTSLIENSYTTNIHATEVIHQDTD